MKFESAAMLIVGFGGFIGAVARYEISQYILSSRFPYATLLVNVLGCFILGFILFHPFSSGGISEDWRLFLCVGILGAFTTMSAFSSETFTMLENHEGMKAMANIIINVVGSILAVFGGRALAMVGYFAEA
jgi:CrcB protein